VQICTHRVVQVWAEGRTAFFFGDLPRLTDCLSVGVHLYGGTALPTCVTRQDCLKEEVPFEQLGASGSNRDYRHRSSFDSPYVRVQLKRGHLSYPLPTYYRLPVRGTCLLETCVMRALAIHVLEGGIDVWRHAGLCPRRQGTLKTSWPTWWRAAWN